MRSRYSNLFHLGSCLAVSAVTSACSISNGFIGSGTTKSTTTASQTQDNKAANDRSKSEPLVSRIKQLFASKDTSTTATVFNSPANTVFDRQRLSNLPSEIEVLGITLNGIDKWKEVLESQIEEITTNYDTYGAYLASRNISALPDLDTAQLKENLLALKDIISRGPDALKQNESALAESLHLGDLLDCLNDVGQTVLGAVNGTVGCVAPEISVAEAAITTAATAGNVANDAVQSSKDKDQAMGQKAPFVAAAGTHAAEAVPCVGGWVSMADHGMQAGKDCKHVKSPFKNISQQNADTVSDAMSYALSD